MTEPTTTWRTSGLRVHFAIQYTKGDGGNQQGRIILLARGPGKLLAYPAGCLNLSGSDSLIQPDRGEYFSVSRFREVNADFGPVARHDEIKDVEVLIFNVAGGLIFAEKLATKLNPTSGEKTQ